MWIIESSEWERVSQAFSECASVSLSAHLTPSQLQEDLRRHQITTGHPFVRPPSSTRFIIIKPQSALVSALIDQTNSTEPKNIGSRLANKLTKLKRYSSDSRLHCIRSTESSSSSSHTHSPCPSPSSSPGVYSLARISPTNASVSLSKRNPDSPAISAPNAPSTFSIERSPQFDSSANKARVAFELDYELETESSQPCDQQSLRVQLQHLRHFAHEFDLWPASPELDDQCAPLSNQASRSSSSLAFSNAAAVSATREKQCTCPQARAPPVIQSASILALQLPPSNQSLPSLTVPMPLPVNTGAANRQLCVNETSRPPSEMHLLSTGVASTGTVSHSRTFRPLAVRPVQPPPQHSHFRVVPAANPHSLRPSRTVPSLEALQRLNQWLPPSAESAGVGGGGTHRAPAPVALVPISRVPISVGRANASMQPTQIAPLPVATPSATPLLAYEYNYYPAVDYNSRPEIVPPRHVYVLLLLLLFFVPLCACHNDLHLICFWCMCIVQRLDARCLRQNISNADVDADADASQSRDRCTAIASASASACVRRSSASDRRASSSQLDLLSALVRARDRLAVHWWAVARVTWTSRCVALVAQFVANEQSRCFGLLVADCQCEQQLGRGRGLGTGVRARSHLTPQALALAPFSLELDLIPPVAPAARPALQATLPSAALPTAVPVAVPTWSRSAVRVSLSASLLLSRARTGPRAQPQRHPTTALPAAAGSERPRRRRRFSRALRPIGFDSDADATREGLVLREPLLQRAH